MAEPDTAHANMVNQQLRPNQVADARVLAAISDIPRENFLEPALKGLAYADVQLPIGCGQTMLSPMVEGRMLQALALQPDDTVLEIGTGSGYFTALLARLAAKVISVEYFETLSRQAQDRLLALGLHNIELAVGDAAKSWPLPERVDAIVITAAFVTLPEDFLNQLKVGGRLLAVVGKAPAMSVQLIQRISEREWQTRTLFETVIPAMIHAEPKAEFEF
ncbi:protein-L-isoaspartate O-methyltransferase [Methylophaga sp.]|uniref:protein-L-isoaspartate O-methyltransferase family protein n=1 Tax=Methylophaga sp. TaxID=2024840 RepID=UPI0025E5A304|nr:protein-L-isoaspartate O-methyltransferase [Methylophaga sp.]